MSKLSFLGDVYLPKVYNARIFKNDFIFNLEAPVSKDTSSPAKGKINLNIDNVDVITKTFGKKPFSVNIANNHIFDYGYNAFHDTKDALENNNIEYFGVNCGSNSITKETIYTLNNQKIAIIGYCCQTTNPGNYDNILSLINIIEIEKKISELKKDNMFVVVNLHFGVEEIKIPKAEDVTLARKIIDLGANLIIGHHAHVVQSYETYKGKKIYYGIGNCIFPDFKLDSYYNGKNFTRVSAKKNRKINNYSLEIIINEKMEVSHSWLFFDGEKLCYSKRPLTFFNVLFKSHLAFNLYVRISTKKRMLLKFIKNPRLLNIRRISYFLGINKR